MKNLVGLHLLPIQCSLKEVKGVLQSAVENGHREVPVACAILLRLSLR